MIEFFVKIAYNAATHRITSRYTNSYITVPVFLHDTVQYFIQTQVCLQLLSRLRLKCDGTRAETRFHLSAKRTSPFKSAGESV